MKPIRSLAEMVARARSDPDRRVALAAGQDPASIEAAARAVREGICRFTLVGEQERIAALCRERGLEEGLFQVEHRAYPEAATARAVELVRTGEAGALMKGLVRTDLYMKAVLDKERGLLPPGALLSHLALFELPAYPKLLFAADQAIIPLPDRAQKEMILDYALAAARRFGIARPKAAFLAATEKVTDRMPATVEARSLAALEEAKGAYLAGPLSLDLAISREAAAAKGIDSPVAGDADILIFPNIEAGNIFYKAATKLAGGTVAAIVTGTTAPCILTSRADSEESKFLSIVLGCLLAAK